MREIRTDSFSFDVPDDGEYFSERGVFTWQNGHHELMIRVTAGTTPEALAAVATNAREAADRTIRASSLQVIGRVEKEPSVKLPASFVTAAPSDRSGLFTQGVIEGDTAVMFATLESLSYGPEHAQMWGAFLRSIRDMPTLED